MIATKIAEVMFWETSDDREGWPPGPESNFHLERRRRPEAALERLLLDLHDQNPDRRPGPQQYLVRRSSRNMNDVSCRDRLACAALDTGPLDLSLGNCLTIYDRSTGAEDPIPLL